MKRLLTLVCALALVSGAGYAQCDWEDVVAGCDWGYWGEVAVDIADANIVEVAEGDTYTFSLGPAYDWVHPVDSDCECQDNTWIFWDYDGGLDDLEFPNFQDVPDGAGGGNGLDPDEQDPYGLWASLSWGDFEDAIYIFVAEQADPPEAIDIGDEAMTLGSGAFQLNVPFFLDVDEAGSSWGFVGLHNNLDTELEIGVIYFNSEGDQLRFDSNVSMYNTAVIPAYASVAYRPVGDLPADLPKSIANRPQHVDAIADGEGDEKNNGAIVIMWNDGDEGALQGRYLQVNGADSSAYLLPAGVAVAK